MSLKSSLITSDSVSDYKQAQCINEKILSALLVFCVLPFLLIDIYFAITSAEKKAPNSLLSIEAYLVIDIIAMYVVFTMCLFTLFIKNPRHILSRRTMFLIELLYIIYSSFIFVYGSIIYIHHYNNYINYNIYIYCLVNSIVKLIALLLFTYKKYLKLLELRTFASDYTVKNDLLNANIVQNSIISASTISSNV